MGNGKHIGLFLATLLCCGMAHFADPASAGTLEVTHLTVKGIINPVVAGYLAREIPKADHAVIIQLDTPGGLDTSMRQIVQSILSARVPVIVYVAPAGARAASAGTFIGLAAHVLVMVPGTSMGAASPVRMGGGIMGEGEESKTLASKVKEDAAAYIRTLARERGKNPSLAEKTVLEAASFNEKEAIANGLADLIVPSMNDLLQKLHGRKVKTASGEVILQTGAKNVVERPMHFQEQVMHELANPNIAYILMMIGIYGVIFGLSNPGLIFPEVVGALALVLSFFALGNLSVNLTGILLMGLAFFFFIAEIFVQPTGILAAGGMVALILGSLLIFNTETPYVTLRLAPGLIAGIAIFTGLFFFTVLTFGIRALHSKVTSGVGGLAGQIGVAKTGLRPKGIVHVQGEDWNAESLEGEIPEGASVKVESVQGLLIKVRKG